MLRLSSLESRNWNAEERPITFESRELRERGDQILRDPVGEVLLTCLPALVRERQHGDGGRGGRDRLRSVEPLEPEIPNPEQRCGRDRPVQNLRPPPADDTRRGLRMTGDGPARGAAGVDTEPSRQTTDAGCARRRQWALPRQAGASMHRSKGVGHLSYLVVRCVHDYRNQKGFGVRHVACAVDGESPLAAEISFKTRLGVGGDHRNEQHAVVDLLVDLAVPGIAASQLALIEPDFDTGGAERSQILWAASTSCEA